MAEASMHNHYSFEDIQRYLQGKMSAAEMHAIEKAALQDPFLADAIEGFNEADLAIAKQHLNEINAGLFAERQQNKVVAFNKRTQWLNVAAIIIVLVGIGIVVSYFLKPSPLNQQKEIAQAKQKPAVAETLKDSVKTMANISTFSPKADTASLIADNTHIKKTQTSLKKSRVNASTINDSNVPQDEARVAIISAAPAAKQNETVVSASGNARLFAAPSDTVHQNLQGRAVGIQTLPTTFSGKVIDENNKPVAGAYIETGDKKSATVTDMNGYFSLQKTDTALNVTASTVGYETRKFYLKAGNNEPVVLKPSGAALNDVVVVGYGTKRKKGSYTELKSLSDSAMPVGGWQNFNNYVLSRLNKDTTAEITTDQADIVEMEFIIDKNGNPGNIKITKSLGKQRDAQAVDILKSGPKWTNPSRSRKTKIAINF